MKWTPIAISLCLAIMAGPNVANAAFLIEIDTDGADDGPFTPSPNFSFGGDTTTASSSIASPTVGLTGGDSIFGGDGVNDPDTYLYRYAPGVDADNLALATGTALNDDGDFAFGLTGGVSGAYRVYATWPETTNVSGGDTTFTLSEVGGDLFSVSLDQNNTGGEWILLGEANLSAGVVYTLAQTAGSNTFVSMRASAAMFERVPEPTSVALTFGAAIGLLGLRGRTH
ncbi:hypothetical protein [Botrimarina mediterranea]|uniref:golvesin C-terminal-like domain-containing protein n=1 Tax=Botrimarina mediterranea TaxID=2528022 RepID=UPI00118CE03F|nr:hypothetical protein K2D_09900 [Planctomycetes bacterium K2D]